MRAIRILCAALLVSGSAIAQQLPVIQLWPEGAPGSHGRQHEPETVKDGVYFSNVHAPSLTVAQADRRHANGAAVIVVPGGGHRMLVFQNEGMVAAKTLNRVGVTAFVLKYRLARDGNSGYSIEGDAAGDLRRAVRWVRANAARYGVDPERIGVMGFSAGGELAALVANHPAPALASGGDALDRQSARPDFQVLVYPGPLGTPATDAKNAPPAFLIAGSRDACCMPPTIALYQQLVAAGVSAELHLYADTDHAFNMGQRGERVSLQHWPDRLADWLSDGGWLVPRAGRQPEGVPAP